jgi:hypothetical protein
MKIQKSSKNVRVPFLARLAPVFVLSLLCITTTARASERWATLEAIHQIENPNDSMAPGPCGELGAYQFREDTWKMHTMAPFSDALDRHTSDTIAVKHYEWLKAELNRHGVEASPYMIALAWNGGIKAALDPNPPASALDYAMRAANLAAELQSRQIADVR